MPTELWAEYLESAYHEYLPLLREQNELSTKTMWILNDLMVGEQNWPVFDQDGAWASGQWKGLWDRDVRIAELDREGVAAELVYFGDVRTNDLFHNVMNAAYPPDVTDAGARAYDRWVHDAFGSQNDRLLLSGAIGSSTDVAGLIAELRWLADRGFVGTYAPGFNWTPGLPPLYDEYWDPIWAAYAELGLVPIVHGGYGMEPGSVHAEIEQATSRVAAKGGSEMDLVIELTSGRFNDTGFFADLTCRKALCQVILGGVFDRHPDLRWMMTEVRADWVPATLRYLDEVFEANRDDLPVERRPSEYWQSNCLAGTSFMHRSEVEHRDEIGVDTLDFGRDYPHTESTWPNTIDYYKILFAGVPKDDVRKILGENAIRFFDLDRSHLAAIAERIGPDLDEITDPDATVEPALVEHLAQRCGVLKPWEGDQRVKALDEALADDLERVRA
ncbi:MAG TPA: amidohydrolase family protein [Acidimicrobiales bacterium]